MTNEHLLAGPIFSKRKAINEAIGFTFKDGELQTVNGAELAAVFDAGMAYQRKSLPAVPGAQPVADEREAAPVFPFLLGEGELRGVWYGETPEGEKGKFWWRRELRAALAAPQPSAKTLPRELMGVREAVSDGAGFWRSCSGCHELNEGHDTGPRSSVLGCALGVGCSECGGIGAVWDTTDYAAMGDALAAGMDQPQPSGNAGELSTAVRDAFVRHFGSDRNWLATEGSYFVEGYRAALATQTSGQAAQSSQIDVDAIMTTAQDFASTWSAIGGLLDPGTMRAKAEEIRENLRAMLTAAASVPVVRPSGQAQQDALTPAVRDVLAERAHQVAIGYDAEHDDEHVNDEIAAVACFYLMPQGAREWPAMETGYGATFGEAIVPSDWHADDGQPRRRQLVMGVAMGLAEIERLDRAAARQGEGSA